MGEGTTRELVLDLCNGSLMSFDCTLTGFTQDERPYVYVHPELVEGHECRPIIRHFIIHKNAKLNLTFKYSGELKKELNLRLDIVGEGAEVNVDGALLLTNQSDVKINVEQNHLVANATSFVKIKTVLQDQTKFDYRGTIFIDENSSQTVANQENKNIVMSENVSVTSVPNIEVLNEDVQCGHGSAIGKLDQEQILYLMSRGLSRSSSEQLLLQSFLNL